MIIYKLMELSIFDSISNLLNKQFVDEFDILDPMIFDYYKEESK
jgi:hypothetical protein